MHRPYDEHVTRRDSQRGDKAAENRDSHVGGETAAAVLGMGTPAQPHRHTTACREGAGHTAAVVKDLIKREDPVMLKGGFTGSVLLHLQHHQK